MKSYHVIVVPLLLLQVHNPSWLHHQSYIMPPTVSVLDLPSRLPFFVFTQHGNTAACSPPPAGRRPDARTGAHHVHPAHLHDGAPDAAAQPPLHGQQRDSQ